LTNDQIRMLTGSRNPDPGQAEFDEARRLIDDGVIAIGTVEAFDCSLRKIGVQFGWRDVTYNALNEGDYSDPDLLPSGAQELFWEQNRWDRKLYEWVTCHGHDA
jgi:hypothetical protein